MRNHNDLGLGVFGMSIKEAYEHGICARCRNTVNKIELSAIELAEYKFGGTCPNCQAEMLRPEHRTKGW